MMWNLFFGARFDDVEFVFWGPVWCGVCFFGSQFDAEFVFLVPSLMWSLFLLGRSLMWSLCFGGQFEGSLSGETGILAQGIKSRTRILCRIHSQLRLTVEHFLPACLPACLPDSLTHSHSHAWRKQGCTWHIPSERAWLPGRGTWEKDYAEPNWRMRTCAFSRGSRCPMMIMMMSAAIHCSVLHTPNIYLNKCASDFLQLFPIHVRLIPSKSFCPVVPACLLAYLPACLPAAHLSFCE